MNEPALAAGAWCWHDAYYASRWSLLDQPAGAGGAGLAAIECNDFMLPPPRLSRVRRPLLGLLPGAPPELWRYSRASLHQLQANAQAHNIRILAWAINSDFTVPGCHWPAQALYLRRGLAAARLLDAPRLRVILGGSTETPASRDGLIVRRLAALVRASPAAVTLENHWGVSADIERHLAIFDAAAAALPDGLRARFGCCFDPGNVPAGPERPRWWGELARRANHFHLKTTAFDAAGDETHLPHAAIFGLLAEAGYRGPVTIEYAGEGDPMDGLRQSLRLYRRLAGR
ncbi:MAG: sugar phosphate isomerase/epimerase [Caldilineales bacterium]|nr:sugar phosphate isomerase/epimerase [Caldilineales bacterium]MCW5881149.1 sugar phosphate isomerase/epimerase [Anaerolineae bacterium]